MRIATTTARRTALAAVVALGFGGAGASVLTTASVARPILDGPSAPKDCRINGGNTIRSGRTGRTGGIEYSCTDGIACQVEGGRVTRKCSHASRQLGAGALGSVRAQGLDRAR